MERDILICAIESSCDDTSAAVLKGRQVLSNVIADQDIHKSFGGVVPELASRAHQQNILPIVGTAIERAKVPADAIQAVAFTAGPGLMGSLLVGASFARGMAIARSIPAYGIHHMRAHVLAHFIEDAHPAPPSFPFICLTVSGGHTQLVRVDGPRDFNIIGQTIDDAAGEAFDKTAKMLGLPYPGGPEVDLRSKMGNPTAFSFSKPRVEGFNFSFSGLKTSILYFLQKQSRKHPGFIEENLNDLCASIQRHIVEILMDKLKAVAQHTGLRQIALAGGVAANSGLREALEEAAAQNNWEIFIPPLRYCTDNAAMIGICAALDMEAGLLPSDETVAARKPLV